ncbi:MAG: thiol-disulfide oxidoreductase [Pseudooceanicola sp.]|jgi:protein-disulfide isomerase|nr:thiol-disulfide oxidoreductase [Pseudooceanicola sp.]|tara:strand:- start:1183 stop:1857 length:675 start_codon:yes stop_codon:yes gene_type:complete
MTRMFALAGGAIAIAAAAYFTFTPGTPGTTAIDPFVGAANAQETTEADTSAIVEMTLGAEDAPVTMVEYASFTCPHCANFHTSSMKQLKSDFIDTGKVKLIYRDVYFDKYGLWASMVARCTGPDKFFGIADLLYKGQRDWVQVGNDTGTIGALRKIGRLAGIEEDQLEACLQDGDKAQALIAWYQENATADEITGTPSFIINGKMVKNQPYDDLKKVIEAELGE